MSRTRARFQTIRNRFKGFWSEFKHSKTGVAGFFLISFFLLIAIFAPFVAPYDPKSLEVAKYSEILSPPTIKHLFGTDEMGRDILSQTIFGARISLLVGFLASFITIGIGALIGILAGYYGGLVDDVLMRITDTFLVIPTLPLMIVLAALLSPSIWNIIIVIGSLSWTWTARIVRSQVLTVKERPFIEAARAIGASDPYIMIYELAPNIMPLVFAQSVLVIADSIISEATLSFLGLGDPTHLSWGIILHYAFKSGSVYYAYWYIAPPAICLILVVLSFTYVGNAMDRILNPRYRTR